MRRRPQNYMASRPVPLGVYIPDVVPDEDRAALAENESFGHTKGMGEDIAVLIVDMTREFVEEGHPNAYPQTGKPAARAIARLMDVASEAGVPGFYSRSLKGTHPAESGRWSATAQDDEATQLTDELSPTDDDVVFGKYKPSVFFGTQLESMLNYAGVDTVVVTGMTTSGCVRATVVDAFAYNYHVVVPEECVADRSQISHEVSLYDMDMKYADVVPLDSLLDELESRVPAGA